MGSCLCVLCRSSYRYKRYPDTPDNEHVTPLPKIKCRVVVPVMQSTQANTLENRSSGNPTLMSDDHNERTSVSDRQELGHQMLKKAVANNHTPAMLRAYYTYFFPYTALVQALECAGAMRNREFAFTKGNSIFVRFVTCPSENVLRETVQRFDATRIDLGGVYTRPMLERPARPDSETFKCVRRELTFDIDLTDYPPTLLTPRTDPANPQFAQSWRFLHVAAVFVSHMLEDNFGFNNVLPVFSGRRGIHIWVNDTRAINMSAEARAAVLDYLNPFDRQGAVSWKTASQPCFRFIAKWIQHGTGKSTFMAMATEQKWFAIDRLKETIFPAIPKTETQQQITTAILACRLQFTREHSSQCEAPPNYEDQLLLTERTWQAIIDTVLTQGSRASATEHPAVMRIVLYLMYPRFDRNVTRGMGHLLKAPFSVHPATLQICVPFDCNKAQEFQNIGAMSLRDLAQSFEANRRTLLRQVLIFKRALVWPQHSVSMHTRPSTGTKSGAATTMRKRSSTGASSTTGAVAREW